MRSRFPAAFGHRHSLLGSSCSRRGVGPPHGRLTTHQKAAGPRRGFHVPHSRITTGLDALSTPGNRRCFPGRMPCPASACRITTARPCTPPAPSHRAGLRLARHQQGFTRFTRPACPSPVILAVRRGLLRLSPRASRCRAAAGRAGVSRRRWAGFRCRYRTPGTSRPSCPAAARRRGRPGGHAGRWRRRSSGRATSGSVGSPGRVRDAAIRSMKNWLVPSVWARWAGAATMRSCASRSAFAVGGRPPVASAT
jgi:hypothetical protein